MMIDCAQIVPVKVNQFRTKPNEILPIILILKPYSRFFMPRNAFLRRRRFS